MRHFIIGIVVLLTFESCKNTTYKIEANNNIETEKKAILKTLENETRSFYSKNHSKWSESYTHTPQVHWVCVEPDVTLRASGWNDLSQFVAGWMKENPVPMDYEKSQFKESNVQITIEGNIAFVSMNGSNIQPDGTTRYTIGSRTMIKDNGVWKIMSMTSYPSDNPNGSTPNVYIHSTNTK